MLTEWMWALLALAAFVAGFTDAVVGGGGLIQLPVMFLVCPNWMPVNVIATNRFASACGTFTAAWQFIKKVKVQWTWILTTIVTAMIMALFGAFLMKQTPPQTFKVWMFVALLIMAIYTYIKKQWGSSHKPEQVKHAILNAALVGVCIGFYNGYLGPGTGSLLVFAYVGILKHDFITASASAKVINFFTDASTLVYFVFIGAINYKFAVPMAACNIIGGYLGSHTAIAKGSSFVRVFFLLLMLILIIRFGYEIFW